MLANIRLCLIVGCLLFPIASAAEEATKPTWYQVEVIIYANKRPLATTESAPLEMRYYPAQTVAISDANISDDTIYSIQQLHQLESYEAIASQSPSADDTADIQDEAFVFKSRSRPIPTQTGTATETDRTQAGPDAESKLQIPQLDLAALFEQHDAIAFAQLDPGAQKLDSVARSISRSSLYRLLLHKTWRQPIVDKTNALPIMLQAGAHYDDLYELEGTLTISKSRFLHVATDLWFTEFTAKYQNPVQREPIDLTPAETNAYPQVKQWEIDRGRYTPVQTHRLHQSRRMKSSTLHYIDHPNFGVLIQIDEYEWQEEGTSN